MKAFSPQTFRFYDTTQEAAPEQDHPEFGKIDCKCFRKKEYFSNDTSLREAKNKMGSWEGKHHLKKKHWKYSHKKTKLTQISDSRFLFCPKQQISLRWPKKALKIELKTSIKNGE